MVATLKEFRSVYPQYSDVPDDRLAEALYARYGEGTSREDFMRELEGKPAVGNRGLMSLFGQSVKKGFGQTGILLGDYLPAMAARAVGADEYAERQLAEARASAEELEAKYPTEFRSYEDVQSARDALRYGVEALGTGLPSILPGLVTGGAGAIAARGLTSALGRGAATFGATAVGSGAQTIPEAYASILAETGQERLGPALVAGGINAALESVLPSSIIGRFSGKAQDALRESIKQRLGLGFVEGAALEGLTEGTQQAVTAAATTFVDSNKEFFSSDNWRQIVDSAIKGAIVGGPVSAVGRALSPRAPEEGTPEGEPAPAAAPSSGGPEPLERVEQPPVTGEGAVPVEGEGAAAPVEGQGAPLEAEGAPAEAEGTAAPAETEGAVPVEGAGVTPAAPVEPAPIAAAPEPQEAEPAPRPTDLPIFSLPKDLSGAKPRYSEGSAQFIPQFTNPVDTALYITAQPTKSKRDEEYRQFLRNVGFLEPQIQRYGKAIRDHIKGLARNEIGSGRTSGTFPVDFMRTEFGPEYAIIAGRSALPEAPRPAAPTPPAAQKPTPKPAAPAAPAAPAPAAPAQPAILQQPAPFKVQPSVRTRLEKAAPGATRLLYELHSRLYPGRSMEIKNTTAKDVFGRMSVVIKGSPQRADFTLYMNFDAIERVYKNNGRTAFLRTLFHEFAHPIAPTWIANADNATVDAVVQQYIKERNPSTLQRWGMYRMLEGRLEGKPDKEALDEILKQTGLTRSDYKKYAGSTADKALLAKTKAGDIGSDYMRSFNEWVAEKGAQWLTKELEGLVPQNVFQRFQKEILDSLRRVYSEVSRLLGIQPTEGAFEQLLREVYGKRVVAPRPRTFYPPQIPVMLTDREPGMFSQESLDQVPAPDTTSEEAKKRQADIESGPQAVTRPLSMLTQPEDNSIAGRTRSLLGEMFGALPGEGLGRAFVRNSISSMVPFLERAETRNLGILLENLMSATGRVMGAVTINPPTYSKEKGVGIYGGDDVKPLIKVFEKVGNAKMPEAQRIAIAQRILAERAAGRDLKFYDAAGNEIRMTTEYLQGEIKKADPDIIEALKEFDKFNGKIVEFAVDTGLIPRSLGERFKTLMYTPFYRAQEQALEENPNITLGGGIYEAIKDPNGINTFNKAVNAGGAIHGNLYENILRNVNAIVSAGLKNVAYQETASTLTQLKRRGGDTTIAEVVDKPADETIQFRVGGADRYMKINDAAMFQAVASLSPTQKNSFIRAASKVTQITRRGITATPPFQLRNLIRALVELKVKTGMPAFEILSGTIKGMRDTWRQGEAYRDILGQTGFGGFGFGSGSVDQAAYMQRVYMSREQPLNAWNGFVRAFDKLEGIGELTEMGPRIAYYNYLKKSGMSDKDAAWEAVNLVNYHRHGAGNGMIGTAISNLIPLVPFLTARIQGLYRLVETGTAGAPKSLIGNGVAGIPTAIVTRGLMVTAINMGVNMMYGEEDWYKKLSEKERLSNMYVKIGDTVVALPRSFEIGELFGGLPTLLIDNIRKGEGNDFARGLSEMLFKTFMVEPIPQFAKPILEVYMNKNMYTGQPIENLADKNKLVELRYDEYTSSFAKMAAHLTKFMGISPKEIDQLLRGYFGTSATLFLGTVDSLVSEGGTRPGGIFGDPQSVAGVVGNLTGVTAILKSESQLNNRFVGDFYKLKEEVTQVVRAMDDAVQKHDIDALRSYAEANPAARPLYTRFNSVAARLTQINAQMDAIRDNPNLMPEQKMTQLEQLRKLKGDTAQQAVTLASQMGVAR